MKTSDEISSNHDDILSSRNNQTDTKLVFYQSLYNRSKTKITSLSPFEEYLHNKLNGEGTHASKDKKLDEVSNEALTKTISHADKKRIYKKSLAVKHSSSIGSYAQSSQETIHPTLKQILNMDLLPESTRASPQKIAGERTKQTPHHRRVFSSKESPIKMRGNVTSLNSKQSFMLTSSESQVLESDLNIDQKFASLVKSQTPNGRFSLNLQSCEKIRRLKLDNPYKGLNNVVYINSDESFNEDSQKELSEEYDTQLRVKPKIYQLDKSEENHLFKKTKKSSAVFDTSNDTNMSMTNISSSRLNLVKSRIPPLCLEDAKVEDLSRSRIRKINNLKGINTSSALIDSSTSRVRSSSTTKRTQKKVELPENKVIPEWIRKRSDFKEAYTKRAVLNKLQVPTICEKISVARSFEEKNLVASWLRGVELFKNLPSQIHFEIAGRITVTYYKEGQISQSKLLYASKMFELVCEQGQEGDCLYIIYDGLIDVYVDGTMVATYKTSESLGRQALENSAPRNATLIARTKGTVLTIDRNDYQGIMMGFINQEKLEYVTFLRGIPFFKQLNEDKIRMLCNNLLGKFYYKDDLIYNTDDEALTFYIVRSGRVSLETNIEVDKENKWPVSKDKWRIRKITRTVVYRTILNPSQWFGETELIRDCKRMTKVVAYDDVYVLYLNKNKFNEIFDAEDLKRFTSLAETQPILNNYLSHDVILNKEKSLKSKTKVMIDAMNSTMKSKNPTELEKFQKTKVGPIISNIKNKLSKHLCQTTIKIRRNDSLISHAADI